MALLSESDAQEVSKLFENLVRTIRVTLFTGEIGCESSSNTEMILRELESLSDNLEVTVYSQLDDGDKAAEFGVDRIPAVFISDGTHSRVRFFGTPSGYEFSSLLTCILDTGSGKEPLSSDMRDFLAGLETDLDINVFVTPACPHCPAAAVLATRMAAASENVVASVVEANEFPELAERYRVQGVPRTIINENLFAEGALPESMLAKALSSALKDDSAPEQINLMDYLSE